MGIPYIGDFAEDAVLTYWWDSNSGDGASITRATDGTVKVIRDDGVDCTGTSVTDNEDSVDTGLHKTIVDTSDGANYAVAHEYLCWVDGAVIDGETVNAGLFAFSIENRVADVARIGGSAQSATDLKDFADTGYNPTTHKVAGVVTVDTVTSATLANGAHGGAGASLNLASGLTANITGNLSGSVGSVTGNVGGSVASVTGAVGSVTAGVTLANGAHGGVGATLVLSDYSAFKATGYSTLDAAGVRTAIGLATANIDTQFKQVKGAVAGKVYRNSGGTEMKYYDSDGNLLSTIAWNAGTTTWDVTWA